MSRSLQFSTTRIVNVSNEAVWRVLGDFGTEHRWTKTLTSCERDTPEVGVGTVRSCKLPRPLMGRSEVKETLTEFEPERVLTYQLDGAAGPFATAAARWSTWRETPNSTAITVRGEF
ncbi:MAG TPA: SRPBCC family protein [Acidimicrobiia bacterium]|nr:SRPBCC family protein [Acidimicrobiia bacterium]